MDTTRRPLVTVGLPVYNGEDYLAEAIESILGQTYDHLELIISDNASSDSTREICEKFASSDQRLVYHRQPVNRGAAFNFNFVLDQAKGEFFKWMAHDDVCKPRFLEACLEAMKSDDTIALAYPTPRDIDSEGEPLVIRDSNLGLDHGDPATRFTRTMSRAHRCIMVFGLIKTSTLRSTGKHGNYPAADRVLIGEIALRGRIHEVPDELFLHREHPKRFSTSLKTQESIVEWFDPSRSNSLNLPTWRRLGEYLKAIARSRVSLPTKVRCFAWMLRWSIDLRSELVGDLRTAASARRRRGRPVTDD